MGKNKGITLIALVITIIVLLIISGISIFFVVGNNGILSKTRQANQETRKEQAKEELYFLLEDIRIQVITQEQRPVMLTDCNQLSGKQGVLEITYINEQEESFAMVTYKGYDFKVDHNLNIQQQEIIPSDGEDRSTWQQEKSSLVLLEHFDENSMVKNANLEMDENLIHTEHKKMGNGSLFLNNTTVYDNNQDLFDFTGNFTIDFWLDLESEQSTSLAGLLVIDKPGGLWIGFENGKFIIRQHSIQTFMSVDSPEIGKWNHIAICRENGILRVFYNGLLKESIENTTHFEKARLCIGTDNYSNFIHNAYIDELRILNGDAKWNSDFEVSNSPYTTQDGYIHHFDFYKVLEDTTILHTTEKRFGTASKYFHNTGIIYNSQEQENYKFESDFTIDYWIKLSNENLTLEWSPILIVEGSNTIGIGINFGKLAVRGDGIHNIVNLDPPPIDQWTHVAICRKDGILYVFYNGILQGTAEYSQTFQAGRLYIGRDYTSQYLRNSYIDELRILNGFGKWTEGFQVPNKQYQY